jgi:glycosyltransferase involved in cell wall biosynthesis
VKILVGAWACNPRQGSEAAVGWTWLAAIKRQHDVHVLTARYQRDWIEAEIRNAPEEFSHVRFHYVEPRFWRYDCSSSFWQWQAGVPLLVPLFHRYYQRWMRAAYKTAFDLNRLFNFDLVHQLTFVGFRFPGHLWRLGVPFVWGPIGGLENMPWRFLPALGVSGTVHYAGRNLVNSLHRRFLRLPRKAFAAAGPGVIAATSGIQSEIRRWYGTDAQVICEIGLPPSSVADAYPQRGSNEPLRITWSGFHFSRKALPLLLKALARLHSDVDWRLDIYGDGPCHQKWRALALNLGLRDRCIWHGKVSRETALASLRRSHLFVITSLQDLTSTVLVEALANGVPVLCPDHCGFSDAINEGCGLKIPISTAHQFIAGLVLGIERLHDEDLRRRLAKGAIERARAFS